MKLKNMMSPRYLIDRLHYLTSQCPLIVRLCVLIRNQVNCVIAYHLGPTSDGAANGEGLLIEHLASEINLFVDVGAHKGDWTVKMLNENPRAKGVLYEPEKKCAEYLDELFEQSRCVEVKNVALSDMVGETRFYVHLHQQHSSLNNKANADDSYIVKVETLDNEFNNNDCQIDYLKIDAEGFDGHVIKGASQLLASKKIRFIQFEYNTYWVQGGMLLRQTIDRLEESGYRVYLIKGDGLHEVLYDYYGEYFRYSNYFALKVEDFPIIKNIIVRN